MPRVNPNKYNNSHMISVDEVVDLASLMDYLNSRCGAPIPTAKDKGLVSKHAESFFKSYPDADWRALTDLATWAKAKNKHLSMPMLVGSWRYAYQDGFLMILSRGGTNDYETLREMLKSVDDPDVRERMINASTATYRDEIYESYHKTNETVHVPPAEEDPLSDLGLATGQAVKVRLSAADLPVIGTVVGLSEKRLRIYLKGQEIPVPLDLVQVRVDGEWIDLL